MIVWGGEDTRKFGGLRVRYRRLQRGFVAYMVSGGLIFCEGGKSSLTISGTGRS
jgi:hypothetical protein